MERPFTHEITYTNDRPIPVADVAASLIANEQLVRDAAMLLEQLFPGVEITQINVDFRSATTSSPLKEILAGAIFVAFQTDLDKEVPELIEKVTGIHVPDDMHALVTVLVFVVAVYGIAKAIEFFGPKKEDASASHQAQPVPSIQGNYNQVVAIGGDLLCLPPERITEALDRKFRGGKARSLARRALQFIRPARREDGAAIEGAGARIDPETISAAPTPFDVTNVDAEEIQEPMLRQTVDVHATDIDSNKTGWAGVLPDVSDKRLRMMLYPTIKPDEIFGRRTIVADVIVVSKLDATGEYDPYLFHVVKIDG